LDGTGLVFPKAWCVASWDVAECSQVFSQFVVGDDAGLWEAVHAFADLDVNIPVVNEWEEVVLANDFFRDDVDAGLSRACVSSFAAMVALSAEDMRGMRMLAGKNSTVSIMRSLPVLEQ
jgi:hypothetical protein